MNSTKILQDVKKIVDSLMDTTSTNDKITILKSIKDPDVKRVFYYTYNQYLTFGVTSANLKKNQAGSENIKDFDLFEILDKLAKRELTGNEAINTCNAIAIGIMLSSGKEVADIWYKILDKDFKCSVGTSMLNKVWAGFIPEFDVALGQAYEDESDMDWNAEYLISRKLDGCRCVLMKRNGVIHTFSRSGLEFNTLDELKREFAKIVGDQDNVVLDGEVCWYDNGKEDFQGVMKQISRKDYTIPTQNLRYFVFDVLTLPEFEAKTSSIILSARLKRFATLKESKIISLIEQKPFDDKMFNLMLEKARSAGWEGLILRKDSFYKGKRSKDILKVKEFKDAEFKVDNNVSSVEIGPMNFNENGKVITKNVVTRFFIKYKGELVGVGSGLTKEQREYYAEHKNELLGADVTIQYFAETVDSKTGKPSLRFPVVKQIYGIEGRKM